MIEDLLIATTSNYQFKDSPDVIVIFITGPGRIFHNPNRIPYLNEYLPDSATHFTPLARRIFWITYIHPQNLYASPVDSACSCAW